MVIDTQTARKDAESTSPVTWPATANTPRGPSAQAPEPFKTKANMTPEEICRRIAEAAYLKAQQRGFAFYLAPRKRIG